MIYELPEQPDLELGTGLIDTLGVEVNDLLDSNFIKPQEENGVVLEQIKQDYNFDEIKDTFDYGIVHESVDFFMVATMKILLKMLNFKTQALIIENLLPLYCQIWGET